MQKSKTFEELIVWQKAHSFVLNVYSLSKKFPASENYGLTSQLRRASVSIAANIAEGYKRKGAADKIRFLNISQASLEECRYYVILSRDLGYIETTDSDKLFKLLEEVSKLLHAYSKAIKTNNLTS